MPFLSTGLRRERSKGFYEEGTRLYAFDRDARGTDLRVRRREKEASDDPNAAQGTEAPGSNAEGAQGAAGMDSQGLSVSAGGILDPSAVSALAGKDNSLDIYSAAARVPLQTEKPENAMEGGRGSCLAASGVWHFQKHLFESSAEAGMNLSL